MYYYGEENPEEYDIIPEEEPFIRPATPLTKKNFKETVKENTRPVCLFGAVPPPEKLGEEVALKAADAWAKTFLELKPDGVIVYDIQVSVMLLSLVGAKKWIAFKKNSQDEKSRSGAERPFPFSKTYCPRKFARELAKRTHLEVIVYQALTPERTVETFNDYLKETIHEYGLKNIVFILLERFLIYS